MLPHIILRFELLTHHKLFLSVLPDTLTIENGNPPKSAPVTTDPTDDIMTDDSEESGDNDSSDDDDEDSDSDVDISADLSCDLQLDKEEHTTGTSGRTAGVKSKLRCLLLQTEDYCIIINIIV